MAIDKLVDSGKLDACCEAEAAAIIAKGGGTAPLAYDFANNKGFADAIEAIPSGGGGDTFRKTSVVVTNNEFDSIVNRANISPLSSNEILIWNIRGTIQQSIGSVGGKFGITVLQNGAVVKNTASYKRMASIAAPDDSKPSSGWTSGGIDRIANGYYSASNNLFYVGLGNTIDFLQIPYNMGFAVEGT